MQRTLSLIHLFILSFLLCQSADAQVYAQLKLRDSSKRYPKINQVEFPGSASTRATYDAIYGHGAMWESEYVAFRVYMDHRQSIDLYGKKHPQMELDSTNFYSNAEWMAKGYGEDILYAGQSVAAGSFRGYVDGQPTYIDSVSARGQRIICEGPDSVKIEVWDKDWKTNGKVLQMRQIYTMLKGHRDVQIDIYLEGADDTDIFCTGAQKLEMDNEGFALSTFTSKPSASKSYGKQKGALCASWGRNIPEKGHPELVEGVGIGVYVPSQFLHKTLEDDLNYLCLVHPVNGHIRYHLAVYAWMQEKDGFKTSNEWFEWLKRWAAQR